MNNTRPTALFHYCSTESFLSIITSSTLRLPLLSLSNDSKEGKLISELFEELTKDSEIDEPLVINWHKERLEEQEKVIEGFGLCLSEKLDSLSQWRGYANDANGVCIGFSTRQIEELLTQLPLSLSLEPVEYDRTKQKERINKIAEFMTASFSKLPNLPSTMEDLIAAGHAHLKDYFDMFINAQWDLLKHAYIFKSDAFQEEQEWRIISTFYKREHEEELHAHCNFYARNNSIIPYLEIDISSMKETLIPVVFKGPKNETPYHTLDRFLKKNGYMNTRLGLSSATYR